MTHGNLYLNSTVLNVDAEKHEQVSVHFKTYLQKTVNSGQYLKTESIVEIRSYE